MTSEVVNLHQRHANSTKEMTWSTRSKSLTLLSLRCSYVDQFQAGWYSRVLWSTVHWGDVTARCQYIQQLSSPWYRQVFLYVCCFWAGSVSVSKWSHGTNPAHVCMYSVIHVANCTNLEHVHVQARSHSFHIVCDVTAQVTHQRAPAADQPGEYTQLLPVHGSAALRHTSRWRHTSTQQVRPSVQF